MDPIAGRFSHRHFGLAPNISDLAIGSVSQKWRAHGSSSEEHFRPLHVEAQAPDWRSSLAERRLRVARLWASQWSDAPIGLPASTGALLAEISPRSPGAQSTIRIAVGYMLTIRLNQDILFGAPYQPRQSVQ